MTTNKVFCVFDDEMYVGSFLKAIFLTRESAEEYIKNYDPEIVGDLSIEEWIAL